MDEPKILDLATLSQYIVLGVDAAGENVTAQSANVTLQDMESMLARAAVSARILAAKAGCMQAIAEANSKPLIKVIQ